MNASIGDDEEQDDPRRFQPDGADPRPSSDAPSIRRPRRRFCLPRFCLPRFGLRSLFIVALLFSLVCGWLGRNAYRVRQEEAAIEALMQAQAAIVLEGEEWRELHPATPVLGTEPVRDDWQELIRRTLGWSERRPIREVVLHGQDPDDPKLARALASLSAFPEIRQVDLRGPALDDKAIPHLAKLKRLDRLAMMETTVTGAGLATLAESVRLTSLSISREAPGARLLQAASKFRDLEGVTLEGLPISRIDMEGIVSLPKLESLTLELLQPAPGEDVYAPLAQARALRYFHESRSGMQDADIRTLSRLPILEHVWLSIASDDNVVPLASLPMLNTIRLNGPITVDGARSFSAARPDVAVAYCIYNSDGHWIRAGESEWDR